MIKSNNKRRQNKLSDVLINTRNLTKSYGTKTAVCNLNLTVNKGDIYGLVGKNGAGKTTLLRMICGLAIPTSGELQLFGESSGGGLNRVRSLTGSIIETPNFFPYLSAEQNLEYYRIQRGVPGKDCIQEALQFVGLSDTGKKKFKAFSLGMKQRLGLALAIMTSPDMLILDEPINGLDPMGIAEFREIILKLNREKNTTILISSHILGELSQMATVYGFIDNGGLIEHITEKALTEKCKRRIRLKVDDAPKAATILENILSVKEFEMISKHELYVNEHLDTPEILNTTLVKNGVMVSEISCCGLNLEDYFINLVGGKRHA